MKTVHVKGLYYITHIDNVPSILRRGILSHQRIQDEGIQFTPIYDEQIVANRGNRMTPDGKSLWRFANVFFQSRNPMLYRVLIEKSVDEIVVIAVRPDILNTMGMYITTGNAASPLSEILPAPTGMKRLGKIIKGTDKVWWKIEDGSKREIMAECLIPEMIPPDFIQAIYVADYKTADKLRASVFMGLPSTIPEPNMFFRVDIRKILNSRLSLVQGDMFFSRMQTFTISVNTVGVMGKGLASRAKYQFSEVYVAYQDFCRKHKLKMGRPLVYTVESSLDQQLADDPETLKDVVLETRFLLFPTKNDWREQSNIVGIEQGLQWLRDNYKREKIESLAIPALGCGLGRLDWCDVGPILCRYLCGLDIPVQLYLPAEKPVEDELLSGEFLLGKRD